MYRCIKGVLLITAMLLPFAGYAEKQPNIVLVLTDDQPYGYLGVTGNNIAKTPNIDKLAGEGVLFTNAHVTSAICMPSRVSIVLSQYERKHGVNFNSGTAVSAEAWKNTYSSVLRRNGYYTGWVGKNHIPVMDRKGTKKVMENSFDYWYASHGHMGFYPKDDFPIFNEADNDTQLEIASEGVDDFLNTNEYKFKKAVTFLDRRPKDQPFMLSINLNLPHTHSAHQMAQRKSDDEIYKSLYRDHDIPLSEHYVAKNDIKNPKLPADLLRAKDRQSSYDYVDNPESTKEFYLRQMQAMTGIDRLVGKLRATLKQKNLDDNTIIIFTSDHGLFMGEHGLGGKALCYEKTTHVPLIVFDPRNRQQQTRSDALISTVDVAPTILSLAGVKAPATYQGEDLKGFLSGKQNSQRSYTYTENLWSTHFGNPRCEAIQNKDWKYIRYYGNNTVSFADKKRYIKELDLQMKDLFMHAKTNVTQYRNFIESSINGEPAVYEELYHLAKDPQELTNLANDPQHQQILQQIQVDWLPQLKSARGNNASQVVVTGGKPLKKL